MFVNIEQVVFEVTRLDLLKFIGCLVVIMSISAILLVIADKKFAIKGQRRVPEKTLFLAGILGGALAEFITMQNVRHKTLHKRFMIGLPVIFCVQIGLFIWWIVTWFK